MEELLQRLISENDDIISECKKLQSISQLPEAGIMRVNQAKHHVEEQLESNPAPFGQEKAVLLQDNMEWIHEALGLYNDLAGLHKAQLAANMEPSCVRNQCGLCNLKSTIDSLVTQMLLKPQLKWSGMENKRIEEDNFHQRLPKYPPTTRDDDGLYQEQENMMGLQQIQKDEQEANSPREESLIMDSLAGRTSYVNHIEEDFTRPSVLIGCACAAVAGVAAAAAVYAADYRYHLTNSIKQSRAVTSIKNTFRSWFPRDENNKRRVDNRYLIHKTI